MTTTTIHPSTAAMMLTDYADAIRCGEASLFGEGEAVVLDEIAEWFKDRSRADRESASMKNLAAGIKAGTTDAEEDGSFVISKREGEAILALFGGSK